MSEHVPILLVLLPLVAAPICVLLRRNAAAWVWAFLISWIVFGLSVALLARVLDEGVIDYALGGWDPPWGIAYRLDPLNAFVLVIVAANAAVVLLFAPESLRHEIPREKRYLVVCVFLLYLTGLLGITITGDVFNVFVFLEIAALSSYVLVSMGPTRRALSAAYRYLIMGTIGSTFILIGIGLMYMMTGTLNMADLAERLVPVAHTRTVIAAFAFLTVGVSIKMALWPLHTWLPNAYTYAPSMVSAFIASTSTKVSFYLLLRVIFTIFGTDFAFDTLHLNALLLPVSLMATVLASTTAIFQQDVKRLLAYSSVAQIGYMVAGLCLATETGLTGSIVHMFNHAFIKGGLFLVMGCLFFQLNSVKLEDLRGAGRTMPLTMAAFVIGGLNLIGVPLTAGFISKWYLVLAAVEQGYWWVVVVMLLSSLLAVVYVWRVVEVAYFHPPPEGIKTLSREAPRSMLIPAWMMIGATLVFGVMAWIPVGIARQAAQSLLGGGP